MKIKVEDFNLEATLDSGQVFGFAKSADKIYSGLIRGHDVRIWQESRRGACLAGRQAVAAPNRGGETPPLQVNTAHPNIRKILMDYFDLDRDLSHVYQILQTDEALAPVCRALKGLRLICQDSWEALACFIISSNNNVKRIQGIWKNLSEYFRAFPTASQIAKSHERILRQLGLGYRAPFLQKTAQFVSVNPECLDVIRSTSYEEARVRVLSFPGIGPKVADCVLLYGFQKHEAFPVDVWILRIIRKLYFRNRKVSEAKVKRFGQKRWRKDAGYVQQYLFHGARIGVI